MVYLGLHTVMQYWDLYDCMDDFDMMVFNVLETTLTTGSYLAMIILQCNKQLEGVVIRMKGYIADVSLLKDEEKLLYHGHSKTVYLMSKYTIIAAATTAYLMYARPLIKVLRGHQGILRPFDISLGFV